MTADGGQDEGDLLAKEDGGDREISSGLCIARDRRRYTKKCCV